MNHFEMKNGALHAEEVAIADIAAAVGTHSPGCNHRNDTVVGRFFNGTGAHGRDLPDHAEVGQAHNAARGNRRSKTPQPEDEKDRRYQVENLYTVDH